MVDRGGFEPPRMVSLRFYRPAQSTTMRPVQNLVPPVGFEPVTRRGLNPLPLALEGMVGVAGFEPAAPWSQTRCATKLRYTPNLRPWPPISLHHGDEYQGREATAASSCTGMPHGGRNEGGWRHPGTTGKDETLKPVWGDRGCMNHPRSLYA